MFMQFNLKTREITIQSLLWTLPVSLSKNPPSPFYLLEGHKRGDENCCVLIVMWGSFVLKWENIQVCLERMKTKLKLM